MAAAEWMRENVSGPIGPINRVWGTSTKARVTHLRTVQGRPGRSVEAHGVDARRDGDGPEPVPDDALPDDPLERGGRAPLHDVGVEEPGEAAVPELRGGVMVGVSISSNRNYE